MVSIAPAQFSLRVLLPFLIWLAATSLFLRTVGLARSGLRLQLPYSSDSSGFEQSKPVRSCSQFSKRVSRQRRFVDGSTGHATLREFEREPQGDGTPCR
jgi:hypothetical protein